MDVESMQYPDSVDGLTFYCECFPGMSASLEKAEDGAVYVGGYSPGIVGALAKATPAIKAGQDKGKIQWGNHQLRWWLWPTDDRRSDGFEEMWRISTELGH